MGLPNRTSINTPAPDRKNGPPAMNPNFILAVRFLLTALVCALALATAIMCILVVVYYNTHDPIIRPSWGSLIFLIVLGFFTGFIYIGYNIVLPLMPFIHYGDFLYSLFMVKIELLLQFAMCVLWVSGALAYANDLRGYENCQFDGYYHYPKPADFHHVCDLTNWAVPLAYATFGVQTLLWGIETVFGLYTFLYLDQESLNEPMFEWGRRAYNWRLGNEPNGAPAASQPRNKNYRASANNGATSPNGSGNGVGRRGQAYHDEEAAHDGEMSEVHSQASLGNRGRRGATYGQDDEVNDNVEDESGWHLREDPSTRA